MSIPKKITDAVTGRDHLQPPATDNKKFPLIAFDSFMQPAQANATTAIKPPLLSPFELISNEMKNTKKEDRVNETQLQMTAVQEEIATDNDFTSLDVQYDFRNPEDVKLSNSQDKDMLINFLSYIGEGELEMEQVKQKIFEMSKDAQSMNAGQMMLAQMEMAKAMHKIEFASIIMSNAVTSLKNLFNNAL
jgi:hypothetical protein